MMLYLKPKVVNILGKTCFINLLSFLLILPKAIGPLFLWSENKTCCCYYISKSKIYWVKYLYSLSIFLKMIRYTSSRNFIWSRLKPIIYRIMKLRHHTRVEILVDCSYKCNQFVLKASIRYTHKKYACTCCHNFIHITGAQRTFPGATTAFEVRNHVGYAKMSLGNVKRASFDHIQIL